MNKYPLIGGSICALVLLVLASLTNVVGYQTVKASNDSGLIEVTSQACGIQGFGNTTVKLTKQQYQDLEQYLVDFRARLNQTTTREEAVPVFKEAVVELDKYGLLPSGMSVRVAQNLVLGVYQHPQLLRLLDNIQKKLSGTNYSDYENYNCFISGRTTTTMSIGPILGLTEYISNYLLWYLGLSGYGYNPLFALVYMVVLELTLFLPLGNVIDNLNPALLLSVIGLGKITHDPGYGGHSYPADGWIHTNGLNGVKNWSGSMFGDLNIVSYYGWFTIPWIIFLSQFNPGMLGFSGIKIGIPLENSFYLGHAIKVKISMQ